MVINRDAFGRLLDDLYRPGLFQDYAPNGLQVQGGENISRIITGVTASEALIDAAIASNAQAIVVHHGYFWKGESATITGMKYRRVSKLIHHGINLYGYHLPMDAHPQIGNNVGLANALGLKSLSALETTKPIDLSIGLVGELESVLDSSKMKAQISLAVGRDVLYEDVAGSIKTVALCTGGAQGYIGKALEVGADLFITGEVSEQTIHVAREERISFCAAGHHATECFGPKLLADYLVREFGLDATFVEIANPA